MLNLTNPRLKNYDTGRGEGVKVREAVTKAFWDEKNKNSWLYYFQKTFQKELYLDSFWPFLMYLRGRNFGWKKIWRIWRMWWNSAKLSSRQNLRFFGICQIEFSLNLSISFFFDFWFFFLTFITLIFIFFWRLWTFWLFSFVS